MRLVVPSSPWVAAATPPCFHTSRWRPRTRRDAGRGGAGRGSRLESHNKTLGKSAAMRLSIGNVHDAALRAPQGTFGRPPLGISEQLVRVAARCSKLLCPSRRKPLWPLWLQYLSSSLSPLSLPLPCAPVYPLSRSGPPLDPPWIPAGALLEPMGFEVPAFGPVPPPLAGPGPPAWALAWAGPTGLSTGTGPGTGPGTGLVPGSCGGDAKTARTGWAGRDGSPEPASPAGQSGRQPAPHTVLP